MVNTVAEVLASSKEKIMPSSSALWYSDKLGVTDKIMCTNVTVKYNTWFSRISGTDKTTSWWGWGELLFNKIVNQWL